MKQSLSNLENTLETPHGTQAAKSPAATSESHSSKSSSVLLNAVKKEISDDSVDQNSFHTRTSPVLKGYTETTSFVASANYPTSSDNMLIKDKKSENGDGKDMKTRNCNNITPGNTLIFDLNLKSF